MMSIFNRKERKDRKETKLTTLFMNGSVAVIFFFHTTKGLTTIPDAPVARHARHETVQESEKV